MPTLKRPVIETVKGTLSTPLDSQEVFTPVLNQYFTDDALTNPYFVDDALTNNYIVRDP